MPRLQTIVVPVDFSANSDWAWRTACDLALMTGSDLHLVHVCPEPLRQVWAGEGFMLDLEALALEWLKEGEERLADMAAPKELGPGRIVRVALLGSPAARIVEYASEQRADLIVMGVTGRGRIDRMLFGSTTAQVVREATCPVLTIRA
jgi:nucleotide-binding universal stress UspA family protein